MFDPILVNGEPLRVMWGSNSPLSPGGYGMTTGLVCRSLRDVLGCEMAVSSTYGHLNGMMLWHDIPIYPQAYRLYGNDIHEAHAERHRAHILLTHQDVPWQDPTQLTKRGMRWVPWFPIDMEPLSFAITNRLHPDYCYQPIAVSRFGQRMARAAGIEMPCVVQGIKATPEGDPDIDARYPPFVPGDRRAARQALGWPEDAFIVGMVAQNRGYPNRKAYPQQLAAFAQFARRHTDALIYIHAFRNDDLDPEAQDDLEVLLGDMADRAIWAHPYDLNMGYSQAQMITRYQAFDVLLSASMAEGACLPLFEAQACGVPVITGDWSAMSENFFAGWCLDRRESEPWWVAPYKAYWRLPHVGAILDRLEDAYTTLQSDNARRLMAEVGRGCVIAAHNQRHITETQWRPVLTEIARRIEAEPIPWHVHSWPGYGRPYADQFVERCHVAGCPAERTTDRANNQTTHHAGAPIVVDGIALQIEDDPRGGVARDIASEIERVYRLQDLNFQPGDVIIDVGAHVGVVSCYLATKWPEVCVSAFEPIPANYARLVRNIAANGLSDRVFPHNLAVTADGRALTLSGDPATNTGHYSAFAEDGPVAHRCESLALTDFIDGLAVNHIALLKLDCEGAEYEILHSLGRKLGTIDALVMEVHENERLRDVHGSGAQLVAFADLNVPYVVASVIAIPDADSADIIITEQEIRDGITRLVLAEHDKG